MLNGTSRLITGVATEDSIATATVRAALELGAQVRCTAFPRDLDAAKAVIAQVGAEIAVDPLDLTDAAAVAS